MVDGDSARCVRRSNVRSAVVFGGVAVAMVAVAFAAVPAYRLICAWTGLEGTPRRGEVARTTSDRTLTVRFDANVHRGLPWSFSPVQTEVVVRVGEPVLVSYQATNRSSRAVVGTATFNVTPKKVAQYFVKQECFCFVEQPLAPGQTMDMPVLFSIDPAFIDDTSVNEVNTMTLSYTFFPLKGDG